MQSLIYKIDYARLNRNRKGLLNINQFIMGDKMFKPLNNAEREEILATVLSQETVSDVLEIIDILWKFGCDVITPPSGYENTCLSQEYLDKMYSHAIDLVRTEKEAREILDCGFFDGISKAMSLMALYKVLTFINSLEELNDLALELLREANMMETFFENKEKFLALFQKKHELEVIMS